MSKLPFSQAADNNKQPVLAVLREVLASTRTTAQTAPPANLPVL